MRSSIVWQLAAMAITLGSAACGGGSDSTGPNNGGNGEFRFTAKIDGANWASNSGAERIGVTVAQAGLYSITGIQLGGADRVASLTDRAVVLASGERRPVGLVINAAFRQPSVQLNGREVRWPPAIGSDLGLLGHPDIWIPATGEQEKSRFLTTADLAALGREAGYNAWARSQGHASRAHRLRRRLACRPRLRRPSLFRARRSCRR